MLLQELTGIKKYYHMREFEFYAMLEKHGIKMVGGGKYGLVLTHDDWNYVVKVFENDPFYLDFVNFVLKHPNKHYPKMLRKPLQMYKFHRRWKDDSEPQKFWIVKIEKLKPLKDLDLKKFIVHNLEDHAFRQIDDRSEEYDRHFYTMHPRVQPDGTTVKGQTLSELFEKYPWWKSLCKAYKDMNGMVEGAPDVHSGNFMQRDDGTIVIIDPVWEGGPTPEQAAWRAYRAELDLDVEYDEPDEIKGPRFQREIDKERAAIIAAREERKNRWISDNFDDDIPF